MRAIDADALIEQTDDKYTFGDIGRYEHDSIVNALNFAPTIEPERKTQWIPCSEKPDTDRNVFVARGTSENMSVCVGHYEHDLKQWYEDRNWFAKCLYDGLYWCEMPPLPAPYQGEGDSNDRQM